MQTYDNLDTEVELRERVKELTCLYEVVHLATTQSEAPLAMLLQGIAELLPPAWQYPEITAGRVVLDDISYATAGFVETDWRQSADVFVHGELRGFIQVVYKEQRPELYEGPFLREERRLIDALAQEVSGIVERHQAQAEKKRLEEQLLHSDRLATLGQLAAGMAHELNEPLGNILGFAQLAEKVPDTPKSVRRDLEKIVHACLHAREVVSKLRLFARQMPVERVKVNLNDTIREALCFMEARCVSQRVGVVSKLASNLAKINADPSQLHQVLINLIVNALQAMPEGGILTVRTCPRSDRVVLRVEDTGVGMDEQVRSKIFLPFFTTKDVDQGTGLGLSIVDSIVKTHGGTIKASSVPGAGTVFEIVLPAEDGAAMLLETSEV